MTETREFIDFTNVEVPRPSRWDRGDGAGAIGTLVEACERAGVPGQLQTSQKLLARAEQLSETARQAKADAAERIRVAMEALAAPGPVDVDHLADVLVATGVWLDNDAPGMGALWNAAQQLRANAVQLAMAEATGIFQRLQGICAKVVAEIAAVPALPRQVWAATSSGAAGELAIHTGHEFAWSMLVKAGGRWDAIHTAAGLLRETGQFTAELNFPNGCPTRIGVMFLNWQPAVEHLEEVQLLPGPLRVLDAHRRGWRPGLWLADDHVRAAAEPKPKRKLLAGFLGG